MLTDANQIVSHLCRDQTSILVHFRWQLSPVEEVYFGEMCNLTKTGTKAFVHNDTQKQFDPTWLPGLLHLVLAYL